MRYVCEGAEAKTKVVGGTKYGYLYLPKTWIGSAVTVVRHEKPVNEKKGIPSKKMAKIKQYAKKMLEAKGYTTSDGPVNIYGKVKNPLMVGAVGKRMVIVSGAFNGIVKREDIDKELASAANVLFILISKDAKISRQAKVRIEALGNVRIWRYIK